MRAATSRRPVPALAAALVLAMAHGAAQAQTPGTGTSPGAARPLEAATGDARHVCAHYDAERAAYTGTVAILEPAGSAGPATAGGTAYRLLVLAMRDEAPEATPQAQALTGHEALALLGAARAALRSGHAEREEYTGSVARERNRLRFTGSDARAMPKTMMVLTAPGLAIVESGPARGRRGARSDGAYRCAPPQAPGSPALLPAHCAEARTGNVDLESFPAPRAEVRLIQRALDGAGMRPGPIDGIFGPRTLAALERWNERDGRAPGRILTYGTLCPLIGTPRATDTP